MLNWFFWIKERRKKESYRNAMVTRLRASFQVMVAFWYILLLLERSCCVMRHWAEGWCLLAAFASGGSILRPWRPSSGSFSNLRPRSGNSTLSRRALAVQGPRREVRGQSCSLFRRTGTPLSWWADWRSSSTPSVPSRSRTSWWY